MSRDEAFDLEVGEGRVGGSLRLPDAARPAPAVLVCGEIPGSTLDHVDLVDDLAAALLAEGIGFAQFDARRDDPAADDDAASIVDDASAVFRWLLLREEIDAQRLGLVGFGLGAIVVACLAARTDQVRRLCLVAPATGQEALARLAKPNGLPPLLSPGLVSPAFLASLAELRPLRDVAVRDRHTLVLHGAADRVIPIDSARAYVDAIELADHPVEFELVARADHAFSETELRGVSVDRLRGFLATMAGTEANGKKE